MVDGNTGTYASTPGFGAPIEEYQTLDSNTASDYGAATITAVEIRAFGYTGTGANDLYLQPLFNDGADPGDNHLTDLPTSSGYCSYVDITSDTNAPGTWTWADVVALQMYVTADVNDNGGPSAWNIGVSIVEIRVTYS